MVYSGRFVAVNLLRSFFRRKWWVCGSILFLCWRTISCISFDMEEHTSLIRRECSYTSFLQFGFVSRVGFVIWCMCWMRLFASAPSSLFILLYTRWGCF